jgi:NADPH-dependent glutamate synthase beta subunit-like oxidoreductase/ferredoxin
MKSEGDSSVNWPEKILAECIGEELPPCQAACPLNIRVREKIRLMQEGNLTGALDVVLERCPFPGILGRICTHPCEQACTRNSLDQPIAIAGLKRYLADLNPDAVLNVAPGPDRPQQIAVVGGGPGGLMAAYDLRLLGYPVTLLEAEPYLGGALRSYIPPYRLPREVLERELSIIEKLGTEVRLRARVGRDIHLEDLRRDFAAVFLALGAHKSLRLQILGEDLTGVMDALGFLKAVNTGIPPEVGRRVAVIGGGNAAVDAARSAWRCGAQEVHLLYRSSAELMPALASEVEEARREGVRLHCLTVPVRLEVDGRVRRLVAQKTELSEPDSSGLCCPLPMADSEFSLKVDTVISAVGQTADFNFFGPGLAFDTATIYRLKADPVTLKTDIPGVFAGGDLVTGPRSAVEAFAAGRRAALAIHCSIQGQPLPEELPPLASRSTNLIVNIAGVATTTRQSMPDLSQDERIDQPNAEVEQGFTDEAARAEANRCLTCVCSECVKNCTFLQHYVKQVPYTEKELVRLLAEQGANDPLIPYSCHYCGLCQAVCPKDLHAGKPCLAAREILVAQGQGPLRPHKSIQNYVKWGASPTFALSRTDPATGKAARVFFPGCSLAGHFTAVVQRAYTYLRKKLPDTGIMLNCCGAPSYFMGEKDVMLHVIGNVARELKKLGTRDVIVACTHCYQTFREFLPEFQIRSIYEVLMETGLPPGAQAASPWTFNIQDACGARQAPNIHEAVRAMVTNLGYAVEEMDHNREHSICCGSGGLVPAVAPELAKKMTDFRLSEATRDLVTYCASCRARLSKAGHPTLHVLDLPFNPDWQQTKTQPPPYNLLRWWRRWRLKRYLGRL